MKSLLLLLAAACLLFPGCAGYTLGAHKPAHLKHIVKLAVPTFENLTLEQRLGSLVTNAVIKQIQNHGSYQIVARSEADAVLQGRISNINRTQFRSDLNNVLRSSQIQATLVCPYTITEKATGKEIYKGYATADSYIILEANLQLSETQLLEDTAQRLAYTLADQISEGW